MLNKTQFLIVLAINLGALFVLINFYIHQGVRVEVKKEVQEKVVYKDRVVETCSQKADLYMREMDKVKDICMSGANSGIEKFEASDNGIPKFSCRN